MPIFIVVYVAVYKWQAKINFFFIFENRGRLKLCCTIVVSFDPFGSVSVLTCDEELPIFAPNLHPIAVCLPPGEWLPHTLHKQTARQMNREHTRLNRFKMWCLLRACTLYAASKASFPVLQWFSLNEYSPCSSAVGIKGRYNLKFLKRTCSDVCCIVTTLRNIRNSCYHLQ